MDIKNESFKRKIKSYVTRFGRITRSQKKFLEKFFPEYEIKYSIDKIDLKKFFLKKNPVVIEVGFGMGETSAQIALKNPQTNFVCIDVYPPGIGNLTRLLVENKINNIKIIRHDASEVFKNMIKKNSIHGVNIFFPDPWPKKRHHKRRLINSKFVKHLNISLIINGYVNIVTDWENYYNQILEFFYGKNFLTLNNYKDNDLIIDTKYKKRGIKLGKKILNAKFIKKS